MAEAGDAGKGAELSASVGDYLKAVWQLSNGGMASPGEIARELGVTAPSVTAMLLKLQRDGLVTYVPYRGADLTPTGRSEALRLVRRHRLLETFLIEDLGFGWDEVHEEAERMEHVMSDRLTERLAQHLGQPAFDPHGDPIPSVDGTLPEGPDVQLSDSKVGTRFVVQRVKTQDSDVLLHLTELGVAPGSEVVVLGREPRGNLLYLDHGDGQDFALSRDLAKLILGYPKE